MKKIAPGEWRISPEPDGRYLLRGTQLDGSKVRLHAATRGHAERLAAEVFRPAPTVPTGVVDATASAPELDDWGLPRVDAQTVGAVNAAVGARPDAPPAPTPAEIAAAREKDETQKKRKKYATSLSELLGSGYAMGIGMVARRSRDPEEFDVVKPNPKHLSDLADCTAEGIKESFGDREIGPWTMCGMLTIGIIGSVFLQSTRKKKAEPAALKSVP